jgi:hypothetical protein
MGHVLDDDDIGFGEFGAFRGIRIEADHAPSACDQVARNRAAHNAKPDDPNRLVHPKFPPKEARAGNGAAAFSIAIDRPVDNRHELDLAALDAGEVRLKQAFGGGAPANADGAAVLSGTAGPARRRYEQTLKIRLFARPVFWPNSIDGQRRPRLN